MYTQKQHIRHAAVRVDLQHTTQIVQSTEDPVMIVTLLVKRDKFSYKTNLLYTCVLCPLLHRYYQTKYNIAVVQ